MCFLKVPSKDPLVLKPKSKPSPRPYTTYNIFFQLEREYILQQELNVIPSLNSEETFHCSDKNYKGPALPPKYQCLLLPTDWYIPGKALRKKRRHRASHGKISFKDLSKKIASAWHNCDDTVKLFCAEVSEIGMMKYKREMLIHNRVNKVDPKKRQAKSTKKSKISPKKKEVIPSTEQLKDNRSSTVSPEVFPECTPSSIEICSECTPSSSMAPLSIDTSSMLSEMPSELSSLFVDISAEHCRVPVRQPSRNNRLGLVDMQDDEIFSIWMSPL